MALKLNETDQWNEYFNIESVESNSTHIFFTRISTNEVAVSISMKRKNPNITLAKKTLIETKEIKRIYGHNPGERLTIGGICEEIESGKHINIKYIIASHRLESRYQCRTKYSLFGYATNNGSTIKSRFQPEFQFRGVTN